LRKREDRLLEKGQARKACSFNEILNHRYRADRAAVDSSLAVAGAALVRPDNRRLVVPELKHFRAYALACTATNTEFNEQLTARGARVII
jgi:hypothetical protein